MKQTKQDFRRCMIGKILATSGAQRRDWSASIVQYLQATDTWLPASGRVAMFGGATSEPDLLPLLPWLHERGIGVAFFAVEAEMMHPYQVRTPEDLLIGKWGVLEPIHTADNRLALADIEVVLTPGVAFDPVHGHRMGRGAGYYDRFFGAPECRARRIGVGFSLQFCESLAVEGHDVPMQAFVTEKGWLEVAEARSHEGESAVPH